MKKTLTALMAACLISMANAETTITINSESTGDIFRINGNNDNTWVYEVTESASVGNIRPNTGGGKVGSVTLNIADNATLTTSGWVGLNHMADINFTGTVILGSNAKLDINGGSLQFNSKNDNPANSGKSTNGIITLGQGATIEATSLSFVQGQTSQSLSITGIFGEAEMAELTADNGVQSKLLTTNLITLTQGVQNMTVDSTTVTLGNIKGLDDLGYSNVGLITSVDQLEVGEYGLLYSTSGFQLAGKIIPEPATATLSLLALAGLAARRRRR